MCPREGPLLDDILAMAGDTILRLFPTKAGSTDLEMRSIDSVAISVSQANASDTIDLAAGIYTLSLSLLIDKALTIQGEGVVVQ